MIVHIKEDESGYKLKMKANSFGAKESENSKNLCRILSDALSARKEWNVRRTTTIDESYGNMYKLQNIVLVGIQGQASLAVQESDRRRHVFNKECRITFLKVLLLLFLCNVLLL